MNGPPKKLILSEVPAFLKADFNVDATRVTVYNWVKLGRRGTFLRTVEEKTRGSRHDTIRVTWSHWVADFVRLTGIGAP